MFAATEVVEVFPSCLWLHEIGDCAKLNDDLYAAVQDMKSAGAGNDRGDGGGWASATDLHERDAFAPLVEYLAAASEGALHFLRYKYDHFYISECWANLNGAGNDHARHHHPNALLSGVYYVRAPVNCGAINFYDPRPQASVLHPAVLESTPHNSHRREIGPGEGLLILFPSWLEHGVDRNESGADRLSISFNVMLTGEIGYPTGLIRH